MIQTAHFKNFQIDEQLIDAKQRNNTKISVVIPALNEAATIGPIVSSIYNKFIHDLPLIDEIVVIDGNSTDQTVRYAENAGAKVYRADHIHPEIVARGKGVALWKSQFVTNGDLLVFIDSDILDFDERFIYGLVGPLLFNHDYSFVKSFYKRPLLHGDDIWPKQGGRVTEILVRPLLSAFLPSLAGLIQPLSGEYSIRRTLMETMNIWSGYGVEIGLLLDIYFKGIMDQVIQVDMENRMHRNRSVEQLGKMSFSILQVIFNRLKKNNIVSVAQLFDTMIMCGESGFCNVESNEQELPCKQTY
ncbi:MAG: glucosyl-3-phosphoglycerate synthase, partial [Fibrobacter sp.]|nr:glucosyl-3-phosphoglycerate synthase [Fibrobacter sp.]